KRNHPPTLMVSPVCRYEPDAFAPSPARMSQGFHTGTPALIRTTLFEPLSLSAFWLAAGPAVGTTPRLHDAGLLKSLVPPCQYESARPAVAGKSSRAARARDALSRNGLNSDLAVVLRFVFIF